MEKYLTISKRKRSFDRLDDNNNQQLDTTDRNVGKTDAKVEDTVPKKLIKNKITVTIYIVCIFIYLALLTVLIQLI